MKIGVPKEIKNHEYRVGLTPASVRELTSRGHEVLVQTGAGVSIGLTDEEYVAAGAKIAADAASIFATAEMIVKVKEPQPQECAMLRPGQILYTYLHLAPDPEQTAALIKSGAICIAYETITGANGGLPLLAPMSEVAGRMAVQAGAAHLEKSKGGMGILPDHEPVLTVIKQGTLTVVEPDGDRHMFEVTDGFISFDSNKLTVAVERGHDVQYSGTAE